MKSGKIAKIGTVLITCLGLAACGGSSESARDDFIDSIFDSLKQAEIFGGVIIDAKQTTDIEFSGNIAFDMNYIDNVSLDLDCTVSTSNGSKLPFGIQYVDNTLYAEYNRYATNEIDMYLSMASLDNIEDVLELFGVSLDLDFDFGQITAYLEATEFVKKSGDVEAHWELDINGTALCFSGTKKGEFTGDIWCDISGANSVTTIAATVTPKEVVSFWAPGEQTLEESWVPLDTLIDSAANTLGYNFFELTGSFDLAVSAAGVDLTLGFTNVTLDLLIDEKGKLQLWMDFDVTTYDMTLLGTRIMVAGNEEPHYYIDDTHAEPTEVGYASTEGIHCTVFYDGNYVYQYREDQVLVATTAGLVGPASGSSQTTLTDKFYTKETLSGFGANFMDDFMVYLLALGQVALDTMDTGDSSWVFDTTQIKYEELLTEFTYETAHEEVITSEADDDDEPDETEPTTIDVPERFVIGADLGSLLFSEDADGVRAEECPITDISLELDLDDYPVVEASEVTEKRVSDIIAKATMSGAAMTLDLAVDYEKCGDLTCEGALAMIEMMSEYASEHTSDPVNKWVLDLMYQENDPWDLTTQDDGDTGDDNPD